MPEHRLAIEPLDAAAFAAYGELIVAGARGAAREINAGTTLRYDDLATIDVAEAGGRPVMSIYRALPRRLPLRLTLMERHPLGSQAFVPLGAQRWLIVVAPAGLPPSADALRCFAAAPGQGVNLARGTWHHPLLALDDGGDFLVIERGGPAEPANCDEHPLDAAAVWIGLP